MPVADYECPNCGMIQEVLRVGPLPKSAKCVCGSIAKRIITWTGAYTGNADDTTYAKVTASVLDPRDKHPFMVEARKDPTKRNVNRALKHKGLRVMDHNEKPPKQETTEQFIERTKPFVANELRKFRRIEI